MFLRHYSATNLGDDLFVHIMSERYRDVFYINRRAKTQVFSEYKNIKPSENFLSSVFSRVRSRLVRKWRLTGQKKISSCDLFVYVGGSIFMERSLLSNWRSELSFYEALKIPYYILGSNFGPYESAEFKEIVKRIVAGSADTCFRDAASYDYFKHIPTVRVAADIAFTLDTSKFELVKSKKNAVISVIDSKNRFDDETAIKYEAEMANLAINLKSQGYNVILMSFCEREGDEDAAERITKVAPNVASIYRYRGNLMEALQIIASAEIVVGSRFHAVILGLVFGSRVLPVAYSGKTLNVLSDLGFRGPIVKLEEIDQFDGKNFDFDELSIQHVSQEKLRAQSQFLILDEVLDKKS